MPPVSEGEKRVIVVQFLVQSGLPEALGASHKSALSLPLACEEIVDLYMKDVDRSLISENLRLSYTQRLLRVQHNARAANEVRGAGIRALKRER